MKSSAKKENSSAKQSLAQQFKEQMGDLIGFAFTSEPVKNAFIRLQGIQQFLIDYNKNSNQWRTFVHRNKHLMPEGNLNHPMGAAVDSNQFQPLLRKLWQENRDQAIEVVRACSLSKKFLLSIHGDLVQYANEEAKQQKPLAIEQSRVNESISLYQNDDAQTHAMEIDQQPVFEQNNAQLSIPQQQSPEIQEAQLLNLFQQMNPLSQVNSIKNILQCHSHMNGVQHTETTCSGILAYIRATIPYNNQMFSLAYPSSIQTFDWQVEQKMDYANAQFALVMGDDQKPQQEHVPQQLSITQDPHVPSANKQDPTIDELLNKQKEPVKDNNFSVEPDFGTYPNAGNLGVQMENPLVTNGDRLDYDDTYMDARHNVQSFMISDYSVIKKNDDSFLVDHTVEPKPQIVKKPTPKGISAEYCQSDDGINIPPKAKKTKTITKQVQALIRDGTKTKKQQSRAKKSIISDIAAERSSIDSHSSQDEESSLEICLDEASSVRAQTKLNTQANKSRIIDSMDNFSDDEKEEVKMPKIPAKGKGTTPRPQETKPYADLDVLDGVNQTYQKAITGLIALNNEQRVFIHPSIFSAGDNIDQSSQFFFNGKLVNEFYTLYKSRIDTTPPKHYLIIIGYNSEKNEFILGDALWQKFSDDAKNCLWGLFKHYVKAQYNQQKNPVLSYEKYGDDKVKTSQTVRLDMGQAYQEKYNDIYVVRALHMILSGMGSNELAQFGHHLDDQDRAIAEARRAVRTGDKMDWRKFIGKSGDGTIPTQISDKIVDDERGKQHQKYINWWNAIYYILTQYEGRISRLPVGVLATAMRQYPELKNKPTVAELDEFMARINDVADEIVFKIYPKNKPNESVKVSLKHTDTLKEEVLEHIQAYWQSVQVTKALGEKM